MTHKSAIFRAVVQRCAMLTVAAALTGSFSFAQEYSQAPMLADLVTQGDLPPVEERLPADPVIVPTVDQIGTYGGTVHTVYTGVSDWWNLALFGARGEPLVQADESGAIHPNLLASYEYRDEGTTLRLVLREGLRWSDGHPVTVDDIIYDLQKRAGGNVPLERAGLAAMVDIDGIERINDVTVDLALATPYPLEFTLPYEPTISPRHYLSQFDPEYTDGVTYDDLERAFSPSRNSAALVDLPTLSPWRVVEYRENDRIVAERNPYFWKVDEAGQQLPYVDRVEFRYVASADSIPALVRTGQVDFLARHVFLSDFPFYRQNEDEGGYRTAILSQANLGPAIHLNYAVEDEGLRALFWERDFRIALSIGIDREAVSSALYFGQADPWGFAPLPASAAYPGDEYATLHTEYDPDRANQLLDDLGFVDTDGDGYRDIDGAATTIVIDMDQGGGGGPVQVAELIASQWEAIGVRAIANSIDRSLILARWEENSHDAFAWNVNGALNPAAFTFAWSTTAAPDFMWGNVGVPLQEWVATDGEQGVEPPAFVQQINDLVVDAEQELDADRRAELLKEATRLHSDQLYKIPTTTLVDIAIVSHDLANVPETWTNGIDVLAPRSIAPWQFFLQR